MLIKGMYFQQYLVQFRNIFKLLTMGQQCSATVQQVQQVIEQHMYEPSTEQIKIQIELMRNKNQDLRNVAQKYFIQSTQQQFLGYMKDGLKQGYGELKIQSEKRYYGYFKDNLPHIKGVLIFSNDHYYMGQFQNGKMHGKGRQQSPFFTFQGQYSYDMKKYGKLSTEDFTYEGCFQDQSGNKFSGYGELRYNNGQRYIGNFLNGQFNGQGMYFSQQNRLIYEGEFKNNLYNGKGKYHWQDGSWFQGDYLNGMKHGEGIYSKQGQHTIEGVWQAGSITARSKSKSAKNTKDNVQMNRSNHSTKMEEVY